MTPGQHVYDGWGKKLQVSKPHLGWRLVGPAHGVKLVDDVAIARLANVPTAHSSHFVSYVQDTQIPWRQGIT
eukprot:scaffold179415_cov54-Prasinocladus_malaysianus.AAC.1